ncbi:MAG: hypothetical protein FWG18_00150 [Alphaproteobacteria bacterium]|nr:hypothetical protein [Alphaproteobacteria bacterium]
MPNPGQLLTFAGYLTRKYPNRNGTQTVSALMSHRYYEIRNPRKAAYQLPRNDFGDYDAYATAERNGVKSKDENGWYYRYALPPQKSKERLSLNVNVTKGLVDVLDKIMLEDAKDKNIQAYKMPNSFDLQEIRHDPVTIYFYKITPDIKQKIVDAVKPFVRDDSKMPQVGTKIAAGIYQDSEPTQEAISQLYEEYKSAGFVGIGAEMLSNALTIANDKRPVVMSAGQFFVWKQFLEELKSDKNAIDPSSLAQYQEWQVEKYKSAYYGRIYQKNFSNNTPDKEVSIKQSNAKIKADLLEYNYLKSVLEKNYDNIMKFGQIRKSKDKPNHFIFVPNFQADAVIRYLSHFGLRFRINNEQNVLEAEDVKDDIALKLINDLFNYQRNKIVQNTIDNNQQNP